MILRIKRLSYLLPSSPVSPKRIGDAQERGYALLIVMMMVTILLVSLTVALPSIYVEGQREREEELIFRGNEYAHAIAFFRRKFNRYPSSVDELLRTNGIRFLRHAYRDPMSRDGKWRFIHAAINGALLDSQSIGPAVGQAIPGQLQNSSGDLGGQGPLGSNQPGSFGSSSSSLLSAGGQGLLGNAQPGSFGLGNTQPGLGNTQPGSLGTSSLLNEGKEIQGGFIAGVASTSSKESIRVLNHKTHYSEWEFLGIEGNPAGGLLPGRPVQPASATQAGQPGSASQTTVLAPGQPQQPTDQQPTDQEPTDQEPPPDQETTQ